MTRALRLALVVALPLAFLVTTGCSSCHEEPTIVIRFEPSDGDVRPARKPSPTPTPTPTPSAAAAPAKPMHECKAASDCIVVPEECCDCANGGKQHAIPKVKVAADKSARAKKCKQVMCTMMASTDPTCGMRPDCVSGACVMIKKK